MPSSPGMTMSVRRRSKRSSASFATAASPSGTATTSCPAWPRARETKAATALSSSAMRIRATPRLAAVDEVDGDAGSRRARLRDAGAEGQAAAGLEMRVGWREGPALHDVVVLVAQQHEDLRHLARPARRVDHRALDDEDRHAVLDVAMGIDVLELEPGSGRRHR